MKKILITQIVLSIDYSGNSKPMIENHITHEVSKETMYRYYFKGGDYIEKDYFRIVRGYVDCHNSILNGKKTVTSDLSVYCFSREKKSYQRLIRERFIIEVKNMKEQVERIHKLYAHEDILDPKSEYIKVSNISK